jgi:type II secretory pathway pseudopilin PulG
LRAFSITEITIAVAVVGILVAVVVPQYTNTSQQTRENSLRGEMQYMRTQIVVFKAQHQDIPPGYPQGVAENSPTETDLLAQMTLHSDITCRVNQWPVGGYLYGPYLRKLPTNPINGLSTFRMIGNNQPFPIADGTTGWIYKPQTQELEPNLEGNDASGTPFSAY